MNKKNILVVITILFLIFLILILNFLTKSPKQLPTSPSSTNTLSLPTQILPPKPTLGANTEYEALKNKLINTHKLSENVTLEYLPKTDEIVIFYFGVRATAEREVSNFLSVEGITNPSVLKLVYLGLDRGEDEAPAGFFQE